MTDEEAFVATIRANPADDTARLVFADWLDERDDPRGAFLRTHKTALLRHPDSESFFETDRQVFSPLLGAEISVSAYTDGAAVQAGQVQAVSHFMAIPPEYRGVLLEPLFENYQATFDAVGEGPQIAGPEQVWAFVRWLHVLVPRQGPSGSRFVFVRGTPAWEKEHGVELLFRDEKLIRVDQASGTFLSECFWNWE